MKRLKLAITFYQHKTVYFVNHFYLFVVLVAAVPSGQTSRHRVEIGRSRFLLNRHGFVIALIISVLLRQPILVVDSRNDMRLER